MTRVGVIARAEDRGLGILTWEVVRHLHPERVAVVDMGELGRGFPQHFDRYPGAEVWPWRDGALPERQVREWLEGLDVVYSAETFYDQRMVGWCNLAGVATVLHAMPEFLYPHQPRPTRVWLPTPWRAEVVGPHQLVPVPVPTDRWSMDHGPCSIDGPLRVLHVAGHKTSADRNGTSAFLRALTLTHGHVEARMVDQDERTWGKRPLGRFTTLEVQGPTRDYWNTYRGSDLLVMPRRYGGLCLPVQEAAGAGLAVVMPQVSPNEWYPATLFRANLTGRLDTPGGRLQLGTPNATHIARLLDTLSRDRDALTRLQETARRWADDHSWTRLLPFWTAQLEAAAG